jgi:hypothetical protein
MSDAYNQPAFPLLNEVSWKGMTLLDYYICHAPVEPWIHWEPQMREKPVGEFFFTVRGIRYEFATEEEAENAQRAESSRADVDIRWEYPYPSAVQHDRQAIEAWETEYVEQRARQWPIYWAMLMLQQRKNVV